LPRSQKELTHKIPHSISKAGKTSVNNDINQWLMVKLIEIEHASQPCIPYNDKSPRWNDIELILRFQIPIGKLIRHEKLAIRHWSFLGVRSHDAVQGIYRILRVR
jgi:hypothetical protein